MRAEANDAEQAAMRIADLRSAPERRKLATRAREQVGLSNEDPGCTAKLLGRSDTSRTAGKEG